MILTPLWRVEILLATIAIDYHDIARLKGGADADATRKIFECAAPRQRREAQRALHHEIFDPYLEDMAKQFVGPMGVEQRHVAIVLAHMDVEQALVVKLMMRHQHAAR